MEKSDRVVIVEAPFAWSDVGSWTSWAELQSADPDGNRVRGDVLLRDARGNIVCSADDGVVALLGIENMIVVRTSDAVLVCPVDRAQEIRDLVAQGKSIRELSARFS
jgi:mannose-1-phosphate guanylyltransferase